MRRFFLLRVIVSFAFAIRQVAVFDTVVRSDVSPKPVARGARVSRHNPYRPNNPYNFTAESKSFLGRMKQLFHDDYRVKGKPRVEGDREMWDRKMGKWEGERGEQKVRRGVRGEVGSFLANS